jgi:phage gpG-like protein
MFIGMAGPKAVHQEGGVVGRYTIPARPFWPWGNQTEDEIIRVWSMYIMVDVFK